MNLLMASTMAFLLGLFVGYQQREIQDLLTRINRKEGRTGVTFGAYKRPEERPPDDIRPEGTGIVRPKTPKRLAWEAEQEMRKTSEKWGVGPPKQGL